MEYTIKSLSEISGVSKRTLRYYDEIGLLKPCRINSSGYRIYGEKEVDLLQQILFYKSMDMKLEDIQNIIFNPDFDIYNSLINHHKELVQRRNQLSQLILTVEKTLLYKKGEIEMTNREKFEGFKKEKIAENEAKYGKEIRSKYGDEYINSCNEKFMKMSELNISDMQKIENEMFEALKEVIITKDLDSDMAKIVFEKHRSWLNFSWPKYSKEAHIGLGEMYVADERFANYYKEKLGPQAAIVLRDIIVKYANEQV